MTPSQSLLLRVTSAQWLKMDDDARAVVFDAIHETVPAGLQLATVVGHAPRPFPFFIEQQTQLGFYLVFGQRFEMGASEEEIADGRRAANRRFEEDGLRLIDGALIKPLHVVDVAPFFAGEAELDTPRWVRVGASEPVKMPLPQHALDALSARGWRLPSEAELDLLRVLSAHSKLERLDSGLCADDWHDDFTGAPANGEPWGEGRGVYRGLDQWDRPWRVYRRKHDVHSKVRPFFSLFPSELGYGDEAISARAAEPVLTAQAA